MNNQLNVVYLDKIDLPVFLVRAVTAPISAIRQYMSNRAAYRSLMKLDDRLLADIGLVRGDVQGAVLGNKFIR